MTLLMWGGHSLTEGLIRSEVDIVADVVDTLCGLYNRLLELDCCFLMLYSQGKNRSTHHRIRYQLNIPPSQQRPSIP